jgi:hypothetical protein
MCISHELLEQVKSPLLGLVYWTIFLRPGPPFRLSALRVPPSRSTFYCGSVWARRALNSQKRRFPARAVVASYVGYYSMYAAHGYQASTPVRGSVSMKVCAGVCF